MVMKSMMELMPELDVIIMLSKMMGASSPTMGWIAHFMIGSVAWGGLFSLLDPHLPWKSHWLKGVIFGIGGWVLMMVAVMPMAGAGLFGMKFGIMAPAMTLVLHVIFGAVMGGIYAQIEDEGLFRDAVEPAPHVRCTSPVQTYLDLYVAGERGREAADHLRKEKLKWPSK